VRIAIVEKPEPLSAASGKEQPTLIDSDARRLLAHELRRYCNGEVTGRSFLIAGHRGSGKTTLVQDVFQRELDNQRQEGYDELLPRLRPLLVVLQGPNLLQGATADESGAGPAPAPAEGGEPKDQTKAAPAARQPNEMENVLIQITLGLYRSMAKEFTRMYRLSTGLDEHGGPMLWRMQKGAEFERELHLRRELAEMAAQFELDLDQYPGSLKLREYWRRGRFLEHGLLFGRSSRMNQGIRELVALSSACDIYRRICGTISQQEKATNTSNRKAEGQLGIEAKGADYLKPLIALLTGGVAGGGVLAASPGAPLTAALTGLVSALGAAAVFKYSASWSRSRSMTQEDLFVPNLSVATLDRVLPVVMERIREAGLAPVFVVEELDKVVGLSSRITEMVRRLKKFVAENAFFCFLTDRAYFEEIRERTAASAYPIEYTYFTNQIFVVFRHGELHRYLDQVLEQPGEAADSQASSDLDAIESAADRQVLPYLLLYGSQMHPIDLRRQLAAFRDSRGEVQLPVGAVRSRPRYRAELMMQVAIEFVMEEEDMQAELDRDPAFLRLAIDAMYYISRNWAAAEERLRLDASGAAAFEDYLSGRMQTDASGESEDEREREAVKGPLKNTNQLIVPPAARRRCRVSPSQASFLMERVRELARALTHPKALRQRAKLKPLPQVVLDALPAEPLLYPVEGMEHVYRWRCYPSGRPTEGGGGAEAKAGLKSKEWKTVAELIDEFAAKLSDATGGSIAPSTLSSQLGVIGTTPAWADVVRARGRLRAAQGTEEEEEGYPAVGADIAMLQGFWELIHGSDRTLTLALLCGTAIGSFRPNPTRRDVLAGLRAISEGYSLREMAASEATGELEHLAKQIRNRLGIELEAQPAADLSSRGSVAQWLEHTEDACNAIRDRVVRAETKLPEIVEQAWAQWFERLKNGESRRFEPFVEHLACMAAAEGPARYLKLDTPSMSVGQWSRALADAAVLWRIGQEYRTPLWLCLSALHQLGFGNQAGRAFLRAVTGAGALLGGPGKPAVYPLTTDQPLTPDEQKELDQWNGGLRDEERPLSALVVSSRGPRAGMWNDRPSGRGAAIVLDLTQAVTFCAGMHGASEGVRKALDLDFVIFEVAPGHPAELTPTEREITSFFGAQADPSQSGEGKCKILRSYALEVPRERTDIQPIKATNLDELFMEAQRLPRRSRTGAARSAAFRIGPFGANI
jgi:hypothetical protein